MFVEPVKSKLIFYNTLDNIGTYCCVTTKHSLSQARKLTDSSWLDRILAEEKNLNDILISPLGPLIIWSSLPYSEKPIKSILKSMR